jgi:hypothetical protein
MTTPFRETQEFLRGRAAELRVAAKLQSFGWFILPASDFTGALRDRAPKITGTQEGIVMPDLLVAKRGLAMWAEVKSKWKPCFYRQTGINYHGVGRRLWRHYHRCQDETGMNVWLFIVEEKTQVLLFQGINELAKWVSPYEGDKVDPGGMVFWPRHVFQSIILNEIPGLFDGHDPAWDPTV